MLVFRTLIIGRMNLKKQRSILRQLLKLKMQNFRQISIVGRHYSLKDLVLRKLNLVAWEDFDENYQAMRNPEKEEKKDTRSAKQKRMDSPDKGINSPAFKEFMRQQGMG